MVSANMKAAEFGILRPPAGRGGEPRTPITLTRNDAMGDCDIRRVGMNPRPRPINFARSMAAAPLRIRAGRIA